MGFKYYEQNQLMIPMEWKTLIFCRWYKNRSKCQ